MTHIDIPFSPSMEEANRQLKKICTSRSKMYGAPGDTFISGGYVFRIVDIIEFSLDFIRDSMYMLEGTDYPEEFEKLWRSLHRGHFTSENFYFTHFYIPIGISEEEDV